MHFEARNSKPPFGRAYGLPRLPGGIFENAKGQDAGQSIFFHYALPQYYFCWSCCLLCGRAVLLVLLLLRAAAAVCQLWLLASRCHTFPATASWMRRRRTRREPAWDATIFTPGGLVGSVGTHSQADCGAVALLHRATRSISCWWDLATCCCTRIIPESVSASSWTT